MSHTRFTVVVEGSVTRYYDSASDAIEFARRCVYLGSERVTDMEHSLSVGQIAEWSYGFSSVCIHPPEGV